MIFTREIPKENGYYWGQWMNVEVAKVEDVKFFGMITYTDDTEVFELCQSTLGLQYDMERLFCEMHFRGATVMTVDEIIQNINDVNHYWDGVVSETEQVWARAVRRGDTYKQRATIMAEKLKRIRVMHVFESRLDKKRSSGGGLRSQSARDWQLDLCRALGEVAFHASDADDTDESDYRDALIALGATVLEALEDYDKKYPDIRGENG